MTRNGNGYTLGEINVIKELYKESLKGNFTFRAEKYRDTVLAKLWARDLVKPLTDNIWTIDFENLCSAL